MIPMTGGSRLSIVIVSGCSHMNLAAYNGMCVPLDTLTSRLGEFRYSSHARANSTPVAPMRAVSRCSHIFNLTPSMHVCNVRNEIGHQTCHRSKHRLSQFTLSREVNCRLPPCSSRSGIGQRFTLLLVRPHRDNNSCRVLSSLTHYRRWNIKDPVLDDSRGQTGSFLCFNFSAGLHDLIQLRIRAFLLSRLSTHWTLTNPSSLDLNI